MVPELFKFVITASPNAAYNWSPYEVSVPATALMVPELFIVPVSCTTVSKPIALLLPATALMVPELLKVVTETPVLLLNIEMPLVMLVSAWPKKVPELSIVENLLFKRAPYPAVLSLKPLIIPSLSKVIVLEDVLLEVNIPTAVLPLKPPPRPRPEIPSIIPVEVFVIDVDGPPLT